MSLKERTERQYRTDRQGDVLRERPPLPRNMMVELSNACNHACAFCPNPHMTRTKGRIDDTLLFRVMTEAAAAGVREIGFYTTGDPFIHKGLAAFTRHAKDAGFEYAYISTNGALATPARAKAVIDAGMDSIKFSINAGSRETYKLIHGVDDFDEVAANLRYISEYRKEHRPEMRLYITCVVTKPMEHEVETIKAMFGPLVDEMTFDPVTPLAWPDPLLNPAHGVCPMPFNRLHVTYEGYLTLCCVDFQNYLAVADLNEMSLKDAWYAPHFVEMRRRHLAQNLAGTLCGRCWHGDSTKVEPVIPALASALDHDAYEQAQRDRVIRELRPAKLPE
jgi:pyruvate-formate lyase-activating enzyme